MAETEQADRVGERGRHLAVAARDKLDEQPVLADCLRDMLIFLVQPGLLR
jgi:hypothetical protein